MNSPPAWSRSSAWADGTQQKLAEQDLFSYLRRAHAIFSSTRFSLWKVDHLCFKMHTD